MNKLIILLVLFTAYTAFSISVYTKGTEQKQFYTTNEIKQINHGKKLFQEYNCIACHQVYGLGGYLGQELTTAYSDKQRGEVYIKALLKSGGSRMPNFNLSDTEINSLTAYLKYIDTTATTYKNAIPFN